jgi:hypothetical protein
MNGIESEFIQNIVSSMIFLSKNGEDPYIEMFARGCGYPVTSTDNFVYENSKDPIVLRGILKHKIMKKCWHDKRIFYYVDTGYFGNEKTPSNPNGWKYWHRIVKNDLQHGEIIPRPADRWAKFNRKFNPWKKTGSKILIAAPDEKPCKFYGTSQEQWVRDTIVEIKKYTDRPVEVRQRSPSRKDRISTNTLQQALDDDTFVLVTFNSVAAVESVFHGIPAFTLAPSNAASPVSLNDLSQIENPYYPDSDKLYAWACHLAYGQFHVSELKDGSAKTKLEEWYDG